MESRYLTDLEWKICHSVNIYVFRNGKEGEHPILVHIPPAKKRDMNTLMGVIQDRMKYPVGYAHRLYTLDGDRICHPCELVTYSSYVVATNYEKHFKFCHYGRRKSPLLVLNRESKHIRVQKNYQRKKRVNGTAQLPFANGDGGEGFNDKRNTGESPYQTSSDKKRGAIIGNTTYKYDVSTAEMDMTTPWENFKENSNVYGSNGDKKEKGCYELKQSASLTELFNSKLRREDIANNNFINASKTKPGESGNFHPNYSNLRYRLGTALSPGYISVPKCPTAFRDELLPDYFVRPPTAYRISDMDYRNNNVRHEIQQFDASKTQKYTYEDKWTAWKRDILSSNREKSFGQYIKCQATEGDGFPGHKTATYQERPKVLHKDPEISNVPNSSLPTMSHFITALPQIPTGYMSQPVVNPFASYLNGPMYLSQPGQLVNVVGHHQLMSLPMMLPQIPSPTAVPVPIVQQQPSGILCQPVGIVRKLTPNGPFVFDPKASEYYMQRSSSDLVTGNDQDEKDDGSDYDDDLLQT